MAGLGLVGVLLLAAGIYFLVTGNIVLGIIFIVLALVFGGGGYGYSRRL